MLVEQVVDILNIHSDSLEWLDRKSRQIQKDISRISNELNYVKGRGLD